MASKDGGGIVYSTSQGRMCPACGKPVADCECRQKQRSAAPQTAGPVRISRDTKGRKGKCVTLVSGVPHCPEALEKLAKQLKQRCGTGGTVKDGVIEIQGDHRDALLAELLKLGFQAKLCGG